MKGIRTFSRRTFCTTVSGTVVSLALGTGCRRRTWSDLPNDGRLTARPNNISEPPASGKLLLALDSVRDAVLYIPRSEHKSPLPLLVFLHGAGQSADDMFWYLGSAHEEAGVAVLAPNSRERTWDAVIDRFGPDVEFLNRALVRVFETVAVDATRIAVGGFSDGASYAISLGLINGDLFKHIVGFSPGFVVNGAPQGRPRFFISHGTRDHILPINRCGRRIANDLKAAGYDVTFREFEGDHEIPADVAREGLHWLTSEPQSDSQKTAQRIHPASSF